LGTISGAKHVHTVAKAYGVPVVLHTDHAARKLLPWIDALLDASEEHFKAYGVPLFSSHMINVHGVYKPGNVSLTPKILDNSQKYIEEKYNTGAKPVDFVFHGGSGSELEDIREAISYGAIKMNIDTDTQWAYWDGVREYAKYHHDYLQGQIGNPEGEDKPNKSYYDPRKWLRAGEESMIARLEQAFDDLNCLNRN